MVATSGSQSRTPLKPFRHFLVKGNRSSKNKEALGRALREERQNLTITDATTILIGNDLTPEERADMIELFAADIHNLRGKQVIAVAVVCD
jgi:hypothetical protein